MDDILLLDSVERYLNGEMGDEEKAGFEHLRKTSPEVDQMVVEHSMFLAQMESFAQNREMKHQLHMIHDTLVQAGDISENTVVTGGKVVTFWKKYIKLTAVAATIAGFTAVAMSVLVTYLSPVPNKTELQMLNKKLEQIQKTQHVQGNQIIEIKSKVPVDERPTIGGTSFLIDQKGYLATNAHVVKGSSTILVVNNRGQEFKTKIAYMDLEKDIAILQINDADFTPVSALPYSFKRNNSDLGEQVFTLGFPKEEIVYNEGYLSSKNGYKGDTISFQLAVSANPGNSGGPVLNKSGEVIGILSTSQLQAEGVVFAIKSKNIYRALDEMKDDTAYQKVKLPTASSIKSLERTQQIKLIEDCVFMVKVFTK